MLCILSNILLDGHHSFCFSTLCKCLVYIGQLIVPICYFKFCFFRTYAILADCFKRLSWWNIGDLPKCLSEGQNVTFHSIEVTRSIHAYGIFLDYSETMTFRSPCLTFDTNHFLLSRWRCQTHITFENFKQTSLCK